MEIPKFKAEHTMFSEYLNLTKKTHSARAIARISLLNIAYAYFFYKIHWLLLSRNQPNAGVNNPTRL